MYQKLWHGAHTLLSFLSPVEKHHFTRVLTTSFFISSSLSASTLFSCSMTSKSSGRDCLLLYFSSASSSLFKKKKTRSYIRKQSYDEKLYTNVPGLTSFLPLLSQFDLKINSRVILQNVGLPYTMLVKYLTSTRRRTAEWKKFTLKIYTTDPWWTKANNLQQLANFISQNNMFCCKTVQQYLLVRYVY